MGTWQLLSFLSFLSNSFHVPSTEPASGGHRQVHRGWGVFKDEEKHEWKDRWVDGG